jgi:ribosomal protein S18 acetylase RimI-like enzyme
MTDTEMESWLAHHHREYVASRIASGEPEAIAEANGASSMARLFPDNVPAPGHSVFVLVEVEDGAVDEGVVVGSLWVGPYPDDRANSMWVWNIDIDEDHRGRGLGRAGMLLAEDEARKRGAKQIGLNVFGFNTVALGLYRSLGFEEASVQMYKVLA